MKWEDKQTMCRLLNDGNSDEAVKFFDKHKDDIDRQALDMFVTGFSLGDCEKLIPIKKSILLYENIELDSIRSNARLQFMVNYLNSTDMDKHAQDKLWDDLSEEWKEKYRKVYKESIDQINTTGIPTFNRARAEARYGMLYDMFGEHNLNPKHVKKEGWVNVYKGTGYIVHTDIYPSKEEAHENRHAVMLPKIATAKIEWEELI